MKNKKTGCLAVVLAIFVGVGIADGAQRATHFKSQAEQKQEKRARSSFRYLIVSNGLLHNGRLVLVLLDIKAFSENNLREVFNLLSKRFPDPEELHLAVFTSLDQLLTPEEEDYAKSAPAKSSLIYKDQVEKYPSAIFTRFAGNEGFRYSLGNRQPEKTVIMKGKDPFLHDKN